VLIIVGIFFLLFPFLGLLLTLLVKYFKNEEDASDQPLQ